MVTSSASDQPMQNRYGTTEHLISVIGEEAMERLIAAYRGQSLRIPKTVESIMFHELCDTIGQQAAEPLILEFGGNEVYVPKAHLVRTYRRHDAIRAEFDQRTRTESATQAIKALARKHDLSERQIHNILKQA